MKFSRLGISPISILFWDRGLFSLSAIKLLSFAPGRGWIFYDFRICLKASRRFGCIFFISASRFYIFYPIKNPIFVNRSQINVFCSEQPSPNESRAGI
jgi:hypothetical protein